MTNKEALDIMKHPMRHPVLMRAAVEHAVRVLMDIEDGCLVCFRPPVPVEHQCYFIHEGTVWGRDVKAYRIRRTGRVYVDLYSPPQGRIFTADEIYPTREAADRVLYGKVAP